MKTFLISMCFVCFAGMLFAQPESKPIIIGQEYALQSKILGQERPLLIYLPKSYEKSKEDYPVMYLLDGWGNFHHTTACVKFLAKNRRIPEMIVVGIPNTDDRTRDLTPETTANEKFFPTAGGADSMLAFMQKELMPFMEENFRISNYKMLVGHSFGGLFAIHALINHPGIFNSYLAISPSLWWDEQKLVLEQSQAFFDTQRVLKGHLYMTMGNEGDDMLGGAWKLAALLEEKGPPQLFWKFKLMEKETHVSVPHRSTYDGLEFIFQKWDIRNSREHIALGGLDAIEDYEDQLKSIYAYTFKWNKGTLSNLGDLILKRGKAEDAVEVFKKCTELFPDDPKIWVKYGNSRIMNNQNEEAISAFKKALEINPKNLQAQTSLKALTGNQ